jgi:hypothetical protein
MTNNWTERFDSLQLLPLFDTKNDSASEDQTDMTNWIIVFDSLHLLALSYTKNESASEDQTHMTTE